MKSTNKYGTCGMLSLVKTLILTDKALRLHNKKNNNNLIELIIHLQPVYKVNIKNSNLSVYCIKS